MKELKQLFPWISQEQEDQIAQLAPLYSDWNSKINVISRKDMDHFFEHHVLHSLSIARFIQFKPGALVMDLGCGGGFPGIPLAILFPQTQFTLVDSIGKKILVVNEVAKAIGLANVKGIKSRAEEIDQEFDFIISRAVAPALSLMQWTKDLLIRGTSHHLTNGWLLLKGGELNQELNEVKSLFPKSTIKVFNLHDEIEIDFFETKKLVYISKG